MCVWFLEGIYRVYVWCIKLLETYMTMSELTVSTCKYMVFIWCSSDISSAWDSRWQRLAGWFWVVAQRGVVPQIGFKNALNTMGLHLQLSEMLELYNRLGTERNRLDINGILWICWIIFGMGGKGGKYGNMPQYYIPLIFGQGFRG